MAKKKAVRKTATRAVALDKLAPVIEALTTTGPGRWGIICDAFEEGLFEDPRLRPCALAALNDRSSDIARTIARYVIPLYGESAYAEIEAMLNINGKWAETDKLKLLHDIDPKRTRPLIERILDEGSNEMRTMVLRWKFYRLPADLPILQQLAGSKARLVREAALGAIVDINSEEVLNLWKRAIATNPSNYLARYAQECNNQSIIQLIAEQIISDIDDICLGGPRKCVEHKIQRVLDLLLSLTGRKDKVLATLLPQMDKRRAAIGKARGGGISFVNPRIDDLIAAYPKRRGSLK